MFAWPTHLWVHLHSTKYSQEQLPGAEGTTQAGDRAPPRLWHFYNNDWDFQRGNELSKSDFSSAWIGLPASGVIFFKTSRSELVTKAFAFFYPPLVLHFPLHRYEAILYYDKQPELSWNTAPAIIPLFQLLISLFHDIPKKIINNNRGQRPFLLLTL